MQITVKRKLLEKSPTPSDKKEKELPSSRVFKPPKFDTDLKNYYYYTEVYKEWFQPK